MVLGENLAHHADKRLQDTVDGQQLLAATTAAQHSGPVAIQAHCAALTKLHIHNGCRPGNTGIWTNCLVLHGTGTKRRYTQTAFVRDHMSNRVPSVVYLRVA